MAKAATGRKLEDFIPAMLAKETAKPFSDEDWVYEIKWDGYRAIAEVKGKDVRLYSRHGNSFNDGYPEVVDALAGLKLNAVLDGEVVVLNEAGNPDFQKLQQYSINRNYPIVYYVFDLLELNGKKLYTKPLVERKKLLAELIKPNDIIKYSDHIEEQGEAFFEAIVKKDMEGVMAKRKSSSYYPGKRTSDWLKIKHHKSEEAIIAGFTSPRGGRKHFGALILGAFANGKLIYIGHTGSGFNTALLKDLSEKLEPLIRETSPFSEKVKTNMPVTWVEPKYVCEVKFSEWTGDGKMRHPIFLRLRDDKDVSDYNGQLIMDNGELKADNGGKTGGKKPISAKNRVIVAEKDHFSGNNDEKSGNKNGKSGTKDEKSGTKDGKSGTKNDKSGNNLGKSGKKIEALGSKDGKPDKKDETSRGENQEIDKIYAFGRIKLKTTNRIKVFFPNDGVTKGDVIDYYDEMAELILPYIKDRPQSLYRTPNGINSKGFFQKDAGDEAPSWFKSIKLYSDSVKKDIHYLLCNDKPSLLYLANLGCIEINPWHSRVKSLDDPDYLIIDIDPSDNNTFDQVVEAANAVKTVLEKAEAFSICKTSGASGLHIYVPLGAQYDYEQAKDFANLVCMMASQLLPDFTTLERNLIKRSKDKIYMDYLQNRRGQTIACVYSLRPKEGATVSTPLDWSEVKKGLHPKQFNINTIAGRLKQVGDLFAPMLDVKNAIDLEECLGKLGG